MLITLQTRATLSLRARKASREATGETSVALLFLAVLAFSRTCVLLSAEESGGSTASQSLPFASPNFPCVRVRVHL